MKLFIKQRKFVFEDKFTVKNERNEVVYYVQEEFFSAGHKIHIYDLNNNEVASVEEEPYLQASRYEIFINGESKGFLAKKFSMFKDKFKLEGTDIKLVGNFLDCDYVMKGTASLFDSCSDDIPKEEKIIMRVYKEWIYDGESYILDIINTEDNLLCLAVMLAVDCDICSKNA